MEHVHKFCPLLLGVYQKNTVLCGKKRRQFLPDFATVRTYEVLGWHPAKVIDARLRGFLVLLAWHQRTLLKPLPLRRCPADQIIRTVSTVRVG